MDAKERISEVKKYLAVGETGKAVETLDGLEAYLEDREKSRHENRVSEGRGAMRQDYYEDVNSTAGYIKDELDSRLKDGERGNGLREWLLEHIHETIDSAGRVIYTAKAQECLLFSDNDGAYFDEFGSDGVVEDGVIQWSRLAYAAFQADVQKSLSDDGVDLNDPDNDDYLESIGLGEKEEEETDAEEEDEADATPEPEKGPPHDAATATGMYDHDDTN